MRLVLVLLLAVCRPFMADADPSVPSDKRGLKDKLMERFFSAPTSSPSSTPSVAPTPGSTGKRPRVWTPGTLDIRPDGHRIRHLAEDLQGNLEEGRLEEFDQILTAEECQGFTDHLDNAYFESGEALEKNNHGRGFKESPYDFQMELSMEDLTSLLKRESVTKIHDTFKNFDPESSIHHIYIRRTEHDDEEKFMDWHVDGDMSVLHLYLNGDEIQGGNLHYMVSSLEGASGHSVIPTQSKTGAGVMIGNRLVHGFKAFQGTRYTLLLVGASPHLKRDIFEEFMAGAKNNAMHNA